MAQLMIRLRKMVNVLGNEGAVANVLSEMGREAAARHAVDQLELRMAVAAGAHPAPWRAAA